TAAILAMLPCTPACFVGLPMGIWALFVLLDPKVRAAFEGASTPLPSRYRNQPWPGARGPALGAGCAILGGVAIAVVGALLVPAIYAVRESASQAQSSNNIKQIGLALHNYHDVYGTFPPAVVRDADGNPLYSGRVLLLPFLGQANLYNSFD